MFECQFVNSIRPPRCGDMIVMNEQAGIKAIIPYLQGSIIIRAKNGSAGIRFGRDIPREGNAQGLASIFFISSSLGLKRPCKASMTGLAI